MRSLRSKLVRAVWLAALLALPEPGRAQAPHTAPPPAAAGGPSFTLIIEAPEPTGARLRQHLDLGRYRDVADLDEVELDRLLVLAQRDARRLLGTWGYFNPRIDLTRDASRRPPQVTVRVDPGVSAVVTQVAIDFTGDIAAPHDVEAERLREALRAGWSLPIGRHWTQTAWDAAKASALRTLVTRRYVGGRIAHSQAAIDAQAGQARLDLQLDSGPTFFLGPLDIVGLDRYDLRLVPRLMRLAPGAVYDEEQLSQAQLRLTQSGYFDSAFLHVDPESDPQAAPVQVHLREASLQRLELGLGVTTDRGPRVSLEHRHNRVPGIDWRAVTRVELERAVSQAQTEWTAIPDEDGWRHSVLASADRLRDDESITQARRLRIGRLLQGEPIDRHAYVQLDRAKVSASPGLPPSATGDGSALTANFLWAGRYFDQLVSPTRGTGLGLEAGAGISLSGPRGAFARVVVRGVRLLPLTHGRLQLRAEGGLVVSQAQTRVPSTQLFRTGGDTTVRGYGFRDIGVERPGLAVSAGRYLTTGSLEWQRPIRRDGAATAWEHSLFADMGLVADRGSRHRPAVGLGTGLRFASPVGPLQADLAYGLRTRRLRLHLRVGVTF